MKRHIIYAAAALAMACACTSVERQSQKALEELNAGWQNPPQSARTRVWWHWMNGNITKDGIRKDIEWFNSIGLGGFQTFDAAMNTPVIVKDRIVYMTDEWKDAFRYAINMADSLGMEVAIASSPGWSSTGGPWVKPQDAMKKLVWRSVYVQGGTVKTALPEPFTVTGNFQNLKAEAGDLAQAASYQYYQDVAVIAVKVPQGRKTAAELGAKVSASKGNPTLELLTDEDLASAFNLPIDEKTGYAWIQYEFPQPTTIYGVRFCGGENLILQTSDNGQHFSQACTIDTSAGVPQSTMAIPATTARYFRVLYPNPKAEESYWGLPTEAPKSTAVSELELLPYSVVHHAEEKGGFSESAASFAQVATPFTDEEFPQEEDVVDVTAFVKDGILSWNAPEGSWKVYRFGCSLTGKQNHPAPAEATGLEVDKLDADAWTAFFHNYLDMYKEASGGMLGQRGIQYVLTDSYEAGIENWTPKMFEQFAVRRGYDLHTWLPAIAGEIIGSPQESDRFLFDWRNTIGELFTENYERLSQIAIKDYGMKGRYTESHENGRAYVGDGMDIKKNAQVPMGAMWVNAPWIAYDVDESGHWRRSMYKADDKESSSVAHLYGQNVAAAESMTAVSGAYSFCPENLKEIADDEIASGINRFVIHESAHQPSDEHVPGLSLTSVGQWFNRHEVWAPMAGTWIDYLSRSCFMLQAGINVADILYYYGEDSNVTYEFGYGHKAPQIPAGYQWDYCNPDALLNQISYSRGSLTSKSGTQYKVIWMDRNMQRMSLPVLRKLAELAKAGAYIGGVRPMEPASLSDSKAEFDALVREIYDSGRQNVVETGNLQALLDRAGVQPDVNIAEPYRFLHRTMKGAEIYWINKYTADYQDVTLSFRTVGMKPMLWHPDNGAIEELSYRQAGNMTEVALKLVPNDAVFVVFAGKADIQQLLPEATETVLATVETPWDIAFQAGRGAPQKAVFDKLMSFTRSADFGIKHFSGIASYTNAVEIPALVNGSKTILDLGSVKNIAEVYVNGEYCGRAWKEPFRVDISKAVKAGRNDIEVRVANLWVNRLIGELDPACPEKLTYIDSPWSVLPGQPLLESGLLGPVTVMRQ